MMAKQNTKRARDTQRSRVYKADEALLRHSRVDVSTVPLIEAYVRRVWADERVRKAFPAIVPYGPCKVEDGRGRKHARGNADRIMLPRWARHESIVIHELAHTITQRTYGWRGVAGHGWQYCGVYLTLTRLMMGREAHDALRDAFRRHRVRYTAPRRRSSRPISAAQRAVLVARLEVARAARAGALAARALLRAP